MARASSIPTENKSVGEEIKTETVKKTVEAKEVKDKEVKTKISDTDNVKIKNEFLINKSVIGLEGKIFNFNDKGISEVDGINAKRFLKIPGYKQV